MKSQNVDTLEIAKFDTLANEWWNPEGTSKPLHQINPLRLQFIMDATALNHKKIIDVGCGGGILSESLARQNANVTGIDMAETVIAVAKQHAAKNHLDIAYKQITVEAMAQSHPEAFDIVTCMELLEHVPNPISVIDACSKLVKPEGYLFFSTLNRNLKSYLHAVIGAEYLLQLLPKGTHDYNKFIRPSELDGWARDAGLSLQHIAGITYNPLTQQYKLTPSVDVNYLVCYQK